MRSGARISSRSIVSSRLANSICWVCVTQGVADAVHGADKLAPKLAAQMMDVNLDGVAGDVVVPGLEFFLDQLSRQHPTGVTH